MSSGKGIIKIDLLGELNRLRDPETDDRDDPSNLLDNTSGGKRIRKEIKAAGSSGNRRLFYSPL
jgi:hypothetical protein